MKYRTILLLLFLIFVIHSCKVDNSPIGITSDSTGNADDSTGNGGIDTTNFVDDSLYANPAGFIPTAAGNFWIYADSIWQNNEIRMSHDTISIKGVELIDDQPWWHLSKISFAAATLGDRFLIRNDTIYSIESNAGGSFASLEFIPPQDTVVTFMTLLGGDVLYPRTVYRLSDPVITPAGSFDSCAIYIHDQGDLIEKYVLCPGAGILYRFVQFDGYGNPFIHTATLIDYYIKER